MYGQDTTVDPESLVRFADTEVGAQDAETPSFEQVGGNSASGSFIRMLLILVIVLGLIFLFFYLLRKITGQQVSVGRNIKILDTHTIKGDTSLMLVEVGKQIFLVGFGSSGINPIGEINDKETADQLRLEEAQVTGSGGNSFLSLFSKSFKGSTVYDGTLEDKAGVTHEHLDKQKERLKKM